MPDSNFKKRYRLSKNSITNLFYELNLEPKQRGNFIDPRIDVLCFLRYLCTGSFMEVSGDLLKISKSSSHRAVHRVMDCTHVQIQSTGAPAIGPPHSGGIWYIGRQIANFRKSKISIYKFNYTNICFSTPAGNILGISPLFRLRKTELKNDLICLI